jgi:hypothetical protein
VPPLLETTRPVVLLLGNHATCSDRSHAHPIPHLSILLTQIINVDDQSAGIARTAHSCAKCTLELCLLRWDTLRDRPEAPTGRADL